MLEQLIYKNHMNEVFEFGKDGIFVDTSDLHDYEWTVTKRNERITNLYRKIGKRKLPVKIVCRSEAEGIAARNRLFEVVEKDVLAMKHGQIILGGYYFKCFVTASKKTDYQRSKNIMQATLTLTTDFPYWVKESTKMFSTTLKETKIVYLSDTVVYGRGGTTAICAVSLPSVGSNVAVIWDGVEYVCTRYNVDGTFSNIGNESLSGLGDIDGREPFGIATEDGLHISIHSADGGQHVISIKSVGSESSGAENADYPFDYPFEYYTRLANDNVNNTGFTASNFKLIIYGACVSPSISIGGHTYKVNCSVGENEHLTIDSAEKKIYITSSTGEVVNKFNSRGREDYIFEKIKPGTHNVVWDGSFGFDVILLEERSEPKWI